MGQQMKFSEDNEKEFSSLSHSEPNLSHKSSKESSHIAVDTMDLESQFNCCCRHSFKELQTVGTDTRDLGSIMPSVMMKSVSIDTSDLPSMTVFCDVSSSNNQSSKPALWNESIDKNAPNSTEFGCQVGFLNDCSSQLNLKDDTAGLKVTDSRDSSCLLESAGLNCTFTTDLNHPLVNQANHCSIQGSQNMINPDEEDSCDMEIIKNYISDLDEDFEEYSASECEETSSSDYNLAELSTLGGESKSLFGPKSCEPMLEKLYVTLKGFTVATTNIKVSMVGNEKQYHCCECDHVFRERISIISHLESHVGFQPFQCIVCEESTSSEIEACSHYEIHHRDKSFGGVESGDLYHEGRIMGEFNSLALDVYTCEKCDETFTSSSSLINHMNVHKLNEDISSSEFSCSVCNISFMCHADVERHKPIHSSHQSIPKENTKSRRKEKVESKPNPTCKERPKREKFGKTARKWICGMCTKAFRTSKALREHEVVHTGARDFPCDICGKAFGTGANMRIHRLTHSDVRPFACQTCGATFRQKDSLKVHARKHTGERPYVCSICKMTFDRSFTLKNHMLTHASEKLFVCSVCGKTFSTRGGLNNHERLHFKDPVESKKERRPRAKPGTGDWVCDECGKIYSTRSNLRMHQRTHQPSQISHVCPVCAKVYKSRDSMEVHMRTHSEVRPYKCPMCTRSFYRNYTLKLHILTHTGEKPHQCPVEGCDRSFAQTSSLSYHIRNHKKQEERSEKKNHTQKSRKQSTISDIPSEKPIASTTKDLMSTLVPENCPTFNEAQEVAQHDLKIGMGVMLPSNIIGDIVLSNNHNEVHQTQSCVHLPNNIDHHLGNVPPVWDDNISLISIMNSVHEPQPLEPQPLPHHASDVNLHSQHCSSSQLMQLVPSEALPMLVAAPVSDLFQQDCSGRSVGSQTLLLQHLS